jgi:hypothetical protein
MGRRTHVEAGDEPVFGGIINIVRIGIYLDL